MFGDQDKPDLEGLGSEAMKERWEEAATAEEADIAATEGPTFPEISLAWLSYPYQSLWSLAYNPKCIPRPNQSRSLARRILPKGLPNSIMGVASAHTHPRTNQACTPTPDNALTSN